MDTGGRAPGAPLTAPAVSPGEYDETYYLEGCAGADVWRESCGAHAAGLYWGSLERARVSAGSTVVDLGTGRGEALVVAREMGAARAVGIDYAPAALRLAARTLRAHGAADRCVAVLGDSRRLPLRDGCADLALMLDIVEHLLPAELDATLREAFRVLRPGGRVLVHTLPSRTLYEVTYRLQRHLPWHRSWPADPRNDNERRMHVNEQTLGSLRASLRRAGFEGVDVHVGRWVHDGFVPSERARRTYHRLAAFPLTARFGAADIWGEAARPAQPGTTTSRPVSSTR